LQHIQRRVSFAAKIIDLKHINEISAREKNITSVNNTTLYIKSSQVVLTILKAEKKNLNIRSYRNRYNLKRVSSMKNIAVGVGKYLTCQLSI
jgi:hypothetical protein